jgi:hypothetical protein
VGSPLTHARGPITVSRITGPVRQTGPDTWALSFNRVGFNNGRRSNDVWLLASHPGDATHQSAVQQANLKFPLRNTAGAAQHIRFPALADVPARGLRRRTQALAATSDAGLPVQYYVQEGPAEVRGSTLIFTPLPPRTRYPVKVVVVAWQYGRSAAPQVQTAEPVTQTFYIRR